MGFLDTRNEPVWHADWTSELGYSSDQFTYGIELEAIDFDWGTKRACPDGAYISSELAVVNSDGYAFRVGETTKGGELNTNPTATIPEQVEMVKEFNRLYPEAKPQHRLKFQTHVGVPGLANDVEGLKRLAEYTFWNVEKFYDRHFNFTCKPVCQQYGREGAKWYRYISYDRSVMPWWRFEQVMQAKTADEFWRNYMLDKKGEYKPMQARRYGVNMLMLKRQGTVEFRHFFPTTDPHHVASCLEYSQKYLVAALRTGEPLDRILDRHDQWVFPPEPEFDPEMEQAFRATRNKRDAQSKEKYVLVGYKAAKGASKEGRAW